MGIKPDGEPEDPGTATITAKDIPMFIDFREFLLTDRARPIATLVTRPGYVVVKNEIVNNQPAVLVENREKGARYWIDPQRGIYLRSGMYRDDEFKNSFRTMDIIRAEEFGGVWLPVEVHERANYLDPKMEWEIRYLVDPKSVKINQNIDKAIFTPKFAAGTIVKDETLRKTHRVSGAGEEE